MAGSPLDQNAVFVHDNSVPPVHNSLFSLFSLKGKTAIVTGGGAGIGLAVAHGLAEAGANIALFYNTNEKAPERAAEIEKQYGVKGKIESLSHWLFAVLLNDCCDSQSIPSRSA